MQTDPRTMKMPTPFEPYQEMAKKIISWMPDWISQNEFDQSAFNSPMIVPIKRSTPILALAGTSMAGEYLPVLQIMQSEGFIESKKHEDGLIYYKAKESL